jgi:hypothetical protein
VPQLAEGLGVHEAGDYSSPSVPGFLKRRA